MQGKSIVSIIIPCYNHGKYLSRALDSVIAQDCDDWEAIIVNDGSTDNTDQVVKNYINRFGGGQKLGISSKRMTEFQKQGMLHVGLLRVNIYYS